MNGSQVLAWYAQDPGSVPSSYRAWEDAVIKRISFLGNTVNT